MDVEGSPDDHPLAADAQRTPPSAEIVILAEVAAQSSISPDADREITIDIDKDANCVCYVWRPCEAAVLA